jgi:hypothetical protein
MALVLEWRGGIAGTSKNPHFVISAKAAIQQNQQPGHRLSPV